MMGGGITVVTEPGQGSTFILTLPSNVIELAEDVSLVD